MAITRRQFITRTGLATAGAFFGPSLFRNPLLRRAMADTIGDRYLIVLFLDGGNDGLNTIIPVSGGSVGMRGDYEKWRHSPATSGGLRIVNPLVPAQPMLDMSTGTQIGFHPGLAGLGDMYDQNRVAVIQGCGYPEYNLSHDVSRSIWRRGAPLSTPSTGWLGRYLAAAGYMGADIPAVTVGGAVAGELSQTATSVLVFDRLRDFGFPYDFDFDGDDDPNPDDTAYKNDVFNALCTAASANAHPYMKYLGTTGTATLLAAGSYPELHNAYVNRPGSLNDAYQNDDPPQGLNTSTARNLREIAKVIYGVAKGAPNVNARFFEFSNGGYDTHSDQGTDNPDDQQYGLHKEIGDAIKLFYQDLASMAAEGGSTGLDNLDSKVCLMVWSEFSRRIEQNDNGTDHGSQGPVLVIGGGVTGGVFGDHPNIAEAALDEDGNTVYKQDTSNGARSTDFRDVYGTIIKHWLNVTDQPTLDGLLPLDTTLGFSGPDYWTGADFDMGFLP